MQIIINPQGKKIPIASGATGAALAKLPTFKGQIGKTSLSELVTGKRKESKGFRIVECEAPKIANKLGVETVGTGKLRQRKPMKIYIKPLHGRGLNERSEGTDFRQFLTAVYHAAKAQGGRVEYSAIAENLGWSRNMVAIYSARAKRLGFVDTMRESNCVWQKGV